MIQKFSQELVDLRKRHGAMNLGKVKKFTSSLLEFLGNQLIEFVNLAKDIPKVTSYTLATPSMDLLS